MTINQEQPLNVTTEQIFSMADQQLSTDGSQPQQPEGDDVQRVPYDRFKEVNDQRKSLEEQNNKLLEMVQQFQSMQQQAQTTQVPQQQEQYQKPMQLLTDEELESLENDMVLNPKDALKRFGDIVVERGVESRVKSFQQQMEEKMQQLTTQMTAQTVPTVIANFKQTRFSPNQVAEMQAFDQAVQGIDPSLLTNPATLENVRLAAIGYVQDQRLSGNQPANAQTNTAFFSESPGSGNGLPVGWGGIGQTQQQTTVPPMVLETAKRLGVDPKESAALYTAMQNSGVFR